MKDQRTLSGKPFRYLGDLSKEIIVYPSDRVGQPQERFALVITPYESEFVSGLIREHGRLLVGASRDRPPKGSLGYFLKEKCLTPQHLSYLIPILAEHGICEVRKESKAFVAKHVES